MEQQLPATYVVVFLEICTGETCHFLCGVLRTPLYSLGKW